MFQNMFTKEQLFEKGIDAINSYIADKNEKLKSTGKVFVIKATSNGDSMVLRAVVVNGSKSKYVAELSLSDVLFSGDMKTAKMAAKMMKIDLDEKLSELSDLLAKNISTEDAWIFSEGRKTICSYIVNDDPKRIIGVERMKEVDIMRLLKG